jgi:hypothetical protein
MSSFLFLVVLFDARGQYRYKISLQIKKFDFILSLFVIDFKTDNTYLRQINYSGLGSK